MRGLSRHFTNFFAKVFLSNCVAKLEGVSGQPCTYSICMQFNDSVFMAQNMRYFNTTATLSQRVWFQVYTTGT